MIRQDPDSYDQKKDSPLIGGYGSRKNINFATEPEVGWGPYVRTCDIITLLEQAAREFPGFGAVTFDNKKLDITTDTGKKVEVDKLLYYRKDRVDAWKRKWLTVPPVSS